MSAGDNSVLPFDVKPLAVRGRLVRLGPVLDDILSRHDYPEPVSALLAEALALTALLGTTLKFKGKFILQTKTDGPVDMIVADFFAPDGLRGYARFDAARIAAMTKPETAELLGKGYLAMTVDQGIDMERYQGIVPLEGGTLLEAAHTYFQQSEQIPTRVKLAAGPLLARGEKRPYWRSGAIIVQHLPGDGGHKTEDKPGSEELEDNWTKASLLLDTVEAHELLDPAVTSETLLYRLYHEDGVTVYPAIHLKRHCTCSRKGVEDMLRRFREVERQAMVLDGDITVTCEFCSTTYRFKPEDLEQASTAE